MNTSTCKTCTFWNQKYPDNKELGVCSKIGIMLWDNGDAAINHKEMYNTMPPITDVQDVRTSADFGCISYFRKPT